MVVAAVAKLDRADAAERLAIVDRLAQQPGAAVTAALGRILQDDNYVDVRRRALRALESRGAPNLIRAIQRGLGDEDPSLRLAVVDALVTAAGREAVPSLGQVLFGDPDSALRLAAVHYLAALPGEAPRALLEAALDDPDPTVHATARAALGIK